MKDIEVTRISATSSLTINLGNFNSGKVEMTIEKTINNPENVDIEEEKRKLWDEVNGQVDQQAKDLRESYNQNER